MSKSIKLPGFILFGVLFLAACSSGPLRDFRTGDEIAVYEFSESGSFEEGAYENGAIRMRVQDDVYRIALDRGQGEIWWGQWGDTLDNVVLDVEIAQSDQQPNHAYGVGCRLTGTVGQNTGIDPALQSLLEDDAEGDEEEFSPEDEGLVPLNQSQQIEVPDVSDDDAPANLPELSNPDTTADTQVVDGAFGNGDGYLFLIQSNGRFSIQRSQRRNLIPLVDWTDSDKINQGTLPNELRAVCMNDYLAFYINDEFVGDVIDDTFSEGQVGLLAATAGRTQVLIDFDNLKVLEANSG